MKTYKWNGPGALSAGGTTIKQGEEIPAEVVKKLEAAREGKKTTTLEDFIKLKSVSLVAPEEAGQVEGGAAEKSLADLTDEEITALALDELSSTRFTKPELQAKAESIGHTTVAGDGKKDFALAIFDHYNQG